MRPSGSRTVAALLLASLLTIAGHPAEAAKTPRGKSAANTGGSATQQIIAITNRERAKHGLPGLKVDGSCVAAISGHVADMAKGGFLSHEGRDGRGANERYRRYKASARGAGENVAYNSTGTGQSFMQQWLSSSDHRNNILNPRYKGIGAAVRSTCASRSGGGKCTYYAGQCFSL